MNESARRRVVAALLVGAGGFFGAIARHGVDLAVSATAAGTGFPLGTLVVNVAGSFALGALTGVVTNRRRRLFLFTGLLSSFTTYSTFAVETSQLGPLAGAGNVAATYAFGILAAIVGVWLGRGAIGGRTR